MKRNELEFQFFAREISKAANARSEYHQERESHWKAEEEKVVALIRKEGITVEDVVQTLSSNSYNSGPAVKIAPALVTDLQKAHTKRVEHQTKATEYKNWVYVFGKTPADRAVQLHADDVLYFHLGDRE